MRWPEPSLPAEPLGGLAEAEAYAAVPVARLLLQQQQDVPAAQQPPGAAAA